MNGPAALDASVLVLNRFYVAIRVISVKRAFALLWKSLAEVVCVEGGTRPLLLGARVALAKPGTGLLEAALLDTPMVAMGRAHPLTAAFVRRAIRVPWLAMPNLIAGREVVPELMQGKARPESLADAVLELVDGPARQRQLRGLAEVRDRLGPGGAAQRVAEMGESLLGPG